jgi:drug/metabolite transporter (DMT)-like permease
MIWLIPALLNPVSESTRSLFIKKASAQVDPLVISWSNNLIPFFLFPISLFFIELKFNTQFWIGFAGSGTIQIINTVLYMRAISKGEISTVMPMLSFTPLVLLITAPILVGEFPSLLGLGGVVLIVVGSYLLNIDLKNMSVLEPLRAIIRNRGTRLMLIVATLWGISGAFDKMALNNSSVFQYITFLNIVVFISTTIMVISQKKFDLKKIREAKTNLFMVSFLTTCSYIFHFAAISMTLVAYVVSLKRLTGMFSVLIGSYFLKEPKMKQRLGGATVMFIGVLLIIFA